MKTFAFLTSVMVWIVVCGVGLGLWITREPNYTTYDSCKQLRKDFPYGIAGEWVPRIDKYTVLNQIGGVWHPQKVSLISTKAYLTQHDWYDYDHDGLMCEPK